MLAWTSVGTLLVGGLAGDVARRPVVAGDDDAGVFAGFADDGGAADVRRVVPHHLRVVAARLPRRRRAAVGVVVVAEPLRHPRRHGVGLGRRRALIGVEIQVLPVVLGRRRLQMAATGVQIRRVVLRERRHSVVPDHRRHSHVDPGHVVRVQVVLRRRHRKWRSH